MSEHPAIRAAKRAVSGCGDPSRGMQEGADRRKMPPVPAGVPQLDAQCVRLTVPPESLPVEMRSWPAFNPSIVAHHGQLLVNVRLHEPNSERSLRRSVNVIAALDPVSGQLDEARLVQYLPDTAAPVYFEDVRLVSLGDCVVGCASACDRVSPPQFAVLDLNNEGHIFAAHVQRSSGVQKNWMPVAVRRPGVVRDALGFIYSTDPIVTVGYELGVCSPAADALPPLTPDSPRGGSQLVPCDDGSWLAVVHQLFGRPPYTHASLVYLHRFARFAPDLRSVTLGPLWHLGHIGIEYVAGLARFEGQWLLSFGRHDREAWLATVRPQTIQEMAP